MSDEITPQAKPIATTGEPEWFPPTQDDDIAAPSQKPGPVHSIFRGADGLRAGWAFLLWLTFAALILRGFNLVLHALLNGHVAPHTMPEWLTLSTSAMGFIAVGGSALLVARMEKRRWTEYGIPSLRGRAADLGMGLLWGFVMLSVLVGILLSGHWIAFNGLHLHGAGVILLSGVLFAVSFLFTGLFEEFAFRGFPQFTLTRGIAGILRGSGKEVHAKAIAFWITAVLLALIFGGLHAGNVGEGRIGVFSAGLIGLVFAFSLWRTGSLWWAIGFHAAWDWAESFFYGTADSGGVSPHRLMESGPQGNTLFSGGTIGPEGSVFVFAVIAIIVLVIALTLKPRAGSASAEMTP